MVTEGVGQRICTVRDVFTHELRVRWGECDPQGIVFNANYLLYFDVAFTELWREAVGPWQEMGERGYDAVVARAELDFRSPARFDDALSLELAIVHLGSSSIRTRMHVRRDADVLVEAELRHVVLSVDGWKPAEMPDWIRSGLQRYGA